MISPVCYLRQTFRWVVSLAVSLLIAQAALAAVYYVGPGGGNTLSTEAAMPGSLRFAVANAPSGSTVILENGTYDAAPNGFFVAHSDVTFRARHWHGAAIINSAGSNLWTSIPGSINDDVMQGMVFGPSTGLSFSGGPDGGSGWQFLDCEFVQNGGFEFGSSGEFLHCLFTDDYSNSFDIGGTQGTIRDCIVRRSNRTSADDDGVGNKEAYTKNLLIDDLVAYDNNGAALWFDTSNDGWVIKNSTFFGNHGGNCWYYCTVAGGISSSQFTGNGQDGQGLSVGQPIMCLTGTPANLGHTSFVTAVSGFNPQTITVSPAFPVSPAANDQIIVQHDHNSSGVGFITEANDNGTFTNNWVYSNTDYGFFDHSSGGTAFGGTGGLIVTDNLFAYDGEGFFVWSDQRDQGPATVEHNRFKFHPGKTSAFDSWGSTPGAYPGRGGITFDYNDYNPDNASGHWAVWFVGSPPPTAGGLTAGSQPAGQDYLQNPSTWDQDMHSNTDAVSFRGVPPAVCIWPDGKDTKWSDVYKPNNKFGLSNSIHQIDDTDGAVENTIDSALAGHKAGDTVTIPVAAHTPLSGTTCEVYDLNGRWVTLTVAAADQAAFLAAVPPYVTCKAGNATVAYKIKVLLNSKQPYTISATYEADR